MQLIVYTENNEKRMEAVKLAEWLNCRFTENRDEALQNGLFLQLKEEGLLLTDGTLTIQGDFTKSLPRLKKNNLQQEMLVKAAKMKGADHPLTAIDATAGFGEDSILLAAAGFEVELYEYDPVIAALLEDAMNRAREIPELAEIAGRMHLHIEDSVQALQNLAANLQKQAVHQESAKSSGSTKLLIEGASETELRKPDIILLDPMFPARSKSGLIKKKFQLLQQLESPCSNEEELLQAAIAVHPGKIVIKRPAKGPFLAGMKPSYQLPGKAIRYDCLVL